MERVGDFGFSRGQMGAKLVPIDSDPAPQKSVAQTMTLAQNAPQISSRYAPVRTISSLSKNLGASDDVTWRSMPLAPGETEFQKIISHRNVHSTSILYLCVSARHVAGRWSSEF